MASDTSPSPCAVVVGGGPAGLMAAEVLSAAGLGVRVVEHMPSLGRKFLMAGKSGLNVTHAEPAQLFLTRYRDADPRLLRAVEAWGAAETTGWMDGLSVPSFTGSAGRVFPVMMKASPLLRAWIGRLAASGVQFDLRHRWTGWSPSGALAVEGPEGPHAIRADVTILALGGGSWRRLGSDGAWQGTLSARGVPVVPFAASNGGVRVPWSDHLKSRFAGHPLKGVRLSVRGPEGEVVSRGEAVLTEAGLEGGGIYQLSRAVRLALAEAGSAQLVVDLCPDRPVTALAERLATPAGRLSFANRLRRQVKVQGAKAALLREGVPGAKGLDPAALAAALKAVPLTVTGLFPLDDAISTAGGVAWEALDEAWMVRALPGVFCAGEMVAWDAPTGGYLLTGCLATGRAAARGALGWLAR